MARLEIDRLCSTVEHFIHNEGTAMPQGSSEAVCITLIGLTCIGLTCEPELPALYLLLNVASNFS